MKPVYHLVNFIFMLGCFTSSIVAEPAANDVKLQAYKSIHIPEVHDHKVGFEQVVVAVIDDGFRLTHKEIKDFIYRNPEEVEGNVIDDDENNYVDDIYGWDISDNDNDVSVIEGREKTFFHGTYISGIIAKVARLHYGESSPDIIRIMPIKVISNHAQRTYINDGYKGIRYAIDNGADIICLAWSGGNPGEKELKLIKEAHQKGILIIAPAGNFNEEKILYPAGFEEVFCVAGLDSNMGKYSKSNYGMLVDISAPAQNVYGAHPAEDNAFIFEDGTSAATALIAGCAAVVMSKNKNLKSTEVKQALMNSSKPFPPEFSIYGGKMGAGIVHLENAIKYISGSEDRDSFFSQYRPKGSFIINNNNFEKTWYINPSGSYHGFFLEGDISGVKYPEKHTIVIAVNDSISNSFKAIDLEGKIYIKGNSLNIRKSGNTFENDGQLSISYYGKTIDSTRLYCSDTKYLYSDTGNVDDGSGDNPYNNNCSCKWLIKVPEGKRIKFTFYEMDTQANVDFVYIVDGKTAIPENFIAKFSGNNLPPVVFSGTNEVLVWFVTDNTVTGRGWGFHYKATDLK